MKLWQFIFEGSRMAWSAIGANRLRSFLTMLGVATGIFAITGILSMVNSLESSLAKNLSALGNTTIFVHHFPWAEGGQEWYKFMNRPHVNYQEYRMLKQRLRRVEGVAFNATMRGQLARSEGRSVNNIELVGTTHELVNIVDMQIERGRYFSPIENHLGNAVCIIGSNISQQLFPDKEPLGQSLRIKGKRFQVVGIRQSQGSNLFGGTSEDDKIWIPYTIMSAMYNLNGRGSEKMIMIKASSYEELPMVENETIGIIRTARGLKPKAENNFAINKQEALMERMSEFFGYFDLGGWVMSIFSILIGGFSIGNIMYISVKERTNEIGVQKALGATRRFVLFQFVSESVFICLLGGIIGLLMVFTMGLMIQVALSIFQVPLIVSYAPQDIMTGLGLAAVIGLVSGFIPASIAAALDPVIAIRQS